MAASQTGEGAASPLWITGLSPPDSSPVAAPSQLPTAPPSPTPRHPAGADELTPQLSDFRLPEMSDFRLPLTAARICIASLRGGYIADTARLLWMTSGGYVGRHSPATLVKSGIVVRLTPRRFDNSDFETPWSR